MLQQPNTSGYSGPWERTREVRLSRCLEVTGTMCLAHCVNHIPRSKLMCAKIAQNHIVQDVLLTVFRYFSSLMQLAVGQERRGRRGQLVDGKVGGSSSWK